MKTPICPSCDFEYPYEEGNQRVCANCEHRWEEKEPGSFTVTDSNGNLLQNWDSIIVIKDLKFKGGVVKQGTKVKNIKLVDADHNIDCKIDGIGAMGLKSEFVRKL